MDMSKNTFVNRLESLRELNSRNTNFINIDLYKLILKEGTLLAAYEKIKSNKGATTPGISLDSFSTLRLDKLKSMLRDESWQPSPARTGR